jgi:hypothetical protein
MTWANADTGADGPNVCTQATAYVQRKKLKKRVAETNQPMYKNPVSLHQNCTRKTPVRRTKQKQLARVFFAAHGIWNLVSPLVHARRVRDGPLRGRRIRRLLRRNCRDACPGNDLMPRTLLFSCPFSCLLLACLLLACLLPCLLLACLCVGRPCVVARAGLVLL